MSSSKNQSAKIALNSATGVMNQAYPIATQGLKQRLSGINSGLAMGGEPGYVADAYSGGRGAITEAMLMAGQQRQGKLDSAASGLNQGGNYQNVLNPQAVGAQLADALFSNRSSQAIGRIDETNNLMNMALGLGGQAGSAQMSAAGNQLGAISMMPDYNTGYATALGFGNIAGSIYGGFNQRPPPPPQAGGGVGWGVGGSSTGAGAGGGMTW